MENTVSERFIDAVRFLKASGSINKYSDLAKELGCSAQILSETMNGRMKVQLEMLQNIFIKYRISYDFIFKNQEPIVNDGIVTFKDCFEKDQSCKLCNEKDKTIAALHDNVELLKERVSDLKQKLSNTNCSSSESLPKTA